jgi:hypothetical protein
MNRATALAILIAVIAFPTPLAAQSSSPSSSPEPVNVQFTAEDVAMLLKATRDVDTSPKITVDLLSKKAADMPSYDPTAHFVGIDPKSGAAVIWVLETAQAKSPATMQALLAAIELACMATGFAGPKWKGIYDHVAALDAAAPPDTVNPYRYRLALTKQIQAIVDSYPHQ